jgi:hypothetical protein
MKRLQVILTDEAWSEIEKVYKDATDGFKTGSINYSDVINEMIVNSKVDLKELRLKHTDIRKSLLNLAKSEHLDVEAAIKALSEIRSRGSKKAKISSHVEEVYE